MLNKLLSKFKKNKEKNVTAKFKVKVHGSEIIDVVLTGKTPKNVADLANRLKASLSIHFKNGQYKSLSKDMEAVFDEAAKVFDKADKVFKDHF